MTETSIPSPILSNLDPDELHKFEAMAAQWWDRTGPCKPLHDLNPLRLDYIQTHSNLSRKTVLDVGCGGGILAEAMAELAAQVVGIDCSDKLLNIARLHGLESGITVEYRHIAVEELATTHPASFDVVTCMEMLEHVPDPSTIVAACAQLVKPGGQVYFSTLNRSLKSYLLAVVGAEYLLGLLPKGTHYYEKFIQPAELAHWCRAGGLEPVNLHGLLYNPLTQRYRLKAGDASVNYILYASKPL